MSRNATPSSENSFAEPSSSGEGFASTQWSVVLSAAKTDPVASREALEALCRSYWQPLYGYVRRTGRSREDAEDLVQGFFASFLKKKAVEKADRERGRFRAYLLACLRHYMFNDWKWNRSQKRGGDAVHLPLDWKSAEERYLGEAGDDLPPDRHFDRGWALTLIERVLRRLQEEFLREGKAEQFEHLKQYLVPGGGEVPHEEMAKTMNTSHEALRVAVHRLRKRYRKLLRQEVAETLSSRELLQEEMRALIAAVAE